MENTPQSLQGYSKEPMKRKTLRMGERGSSMSIALEEVRSKRMEEFVLERREITPL